MQEKIIIRSEHYNLAKIRIVLCLVCGVSVALGIVLYLLDFNDCTYYSILGNMILPFDYVPVGLLIDLGILVFIIFMVIYAWLKSYSLTVTDKRIYGKSSWGKQIDLPVDSISAVSSSSMKGIFVATSSGRIAFKLVKNRDEVRAAISCLLINRQFGPSAPIAINTNKAPQSAAAELKEYKELLDLGIITQEEFDAKKKQLLGL